MTTHALAGAPSWDGSLSTGQGLWLSLGIAVGLWVLVGIPAYLVHRRRKQLGLPRRDNFYSAALRRDTVERRIVVSAAAATLALLMVVGFVFLLGSVAFRWPQPRVSTMLGLGYFLFNILVSVFYLRHWR